MATCAVRRWSIDSAVEPYNSRCESRDPSEGRGSFFSLRPATFLYPPVAELSAEPLGPVRHPFLPQSTQFSPRSVGSCPSAPEPTGVSPPDFRYADCRGFLESVCDAIFLAYDRFFIYFCAPDSGRVRMRSFSAPNGKMKDLKISCLMKSFCGSPCFGCDDGLLRRCR